MEQDDSSAPAEVEEIGLGHEKTQDESQEELEIQKELYRSS